MAVTYPSIQQVLNMSRSLFDWQLTDAQPSLMWQRVGETISDELDKQGLVEVR